MQFARNCAHLVQICAHFVQQIDYQAATNFVGKVKMMYSLRWKTPNIDLIGSKKLNDEDNRPSSINGSALLLTKKCLTKELILN